MKEININGIEESFNKFFFGDPLKSPQDSLITVGDNLIIIRRFGSTPYRYEAYTNIGKNKYLRGEWMIVEVIKRLAEGNNIDTIIKYDKDEVAIIDSTGLLSEDFEALKAEIDWWNTRDREVFIEWR